MQVGVVAVQLDTHPYLWVDIVGRITSPINHASEWINVAKPKRQRVLLCGVKQ